MPRLTISFFALLPAALAFAAPAAAQGVDEKINQLIIYGDDACPQSSATGGSVSPSGSNGR